jgi:hypothetical protein
LVKRICCFCYDDVVIVYEIVFAKTQKALRFDALIEKKVFTNYTSSRRADATGTTQPTRRLGLCSTRDQGLQASRSTRRFFAGLVKQIRLQCFFFSFYLELEQRFICSGRALEDKFMF